MTGAIEFLRKAKAICESRGEKCPMCTECPAYELCIGVAEDIENEADLVRKVMAYQLKDGGK